MLPASPVKTATSFPPFISRASGKGRLLPRSINLLSTCKSRLQSVTSILNYKHVKSSIDKDMKVSDLFTNLVVGLVPITNKKSEFTIRGRIWDVYNRPLCNVESSKTTSSFMNFGCWEICVCSNLIFYLKFVCPIAVRWDWAICSQNSILP